MDFSEKVKYTRALLLISQKDLVKLLRVSNAKICRWEKQVVNPIFLAEKKFDALCKKKDIKFKEK